MKRLTHLIPLSVMAVLLFVSVAMAQSVPEQGAPDQYGTDQYSDTDQSTPPAQTVNNVLEFRLVTVDIEPWGFWHAEMPVEPGTSVRWLNLDDKPHTVTADDGSFDSGVLESGEFFDFRFDAPGKWTYHSELDPGMTGSVIVGQATLPGDSADDASMPPTETSTLPTHDGADEAADDIDEAADEAADDIDEAADEAADDIDDAT